MKKMLLLGAIVLFPLILLTSCDYGDGEINSSNSLYTNFDNYFISKDSNEYRPSDNSEDSLTASAVCFIFEESNDSADFAETVSDSNTVYPMPAPPIVEVSWLPFEQTLAEFTTDVVIVQYVESRPFGQHMTEFEFVVLERILGNAADRIFVYAEFAGDDRLAPTSAHIGGLGLTFNPDTTYLLPLIKIVHPQATTHDDGYRFIQYAIFDLDNPSNSVVLGRPLSQQFASLNINENISGEEIVSFVTELTRDNPPARDIIRSNAIADIVSGSPYIVVVEIGRPLRLSNEQVSTDWGATDLYYVTAMQVLKGNFTTPDGFLVIFPADTVFRGERHIVAIEPISEGSSWFQFTSRNSLFGMEQMDYIMEILSRSEVDN